MNTTVSYQKRPDTKSSSVFREFLLYTILNVLGMIGLSCYILADTFFIAKGLGAYGLAALNLAIPVYSFIHGCALMLGMGSAPRYSVLKGQSATEEARAVFCHTLVMTVFFAALFVVLGLFCSEQITSLLGADTEIFAMTNTYLNVILLFSPAFLLNEVLICFVRNDGNPKLAMFGMLFGSLSNILFDYLFIFPFHMGIFGAVLATGVAPLISMGMLSLHWITKKNDSALDIHKLFQKHNQHTLTDSRMRLFTQILSLGFPSLIAELASGIVMIVFNGIILSLQGNVGVAAYGVIANLSLVVIAIYTGIGQGMQPLVSQAFGQSCNRSHSDKESMDKESMDKEFTDKSVGSPKQIFRYAIVFVLLVSVLIYTVIFLFADPIASLFNSEHNLRLQELAVPGLRLYFTSIPFAGFNIVLALFFTSTMRAFPAQVISLLRGLFLVIPTAFLLSALAGMTGVWLTLPVTEGIVALVGVMMFRKNSY